MRKLAAIVMMSFLAGLGVLGCGGHAGIGNITSTISPSGTISLDAGQSITFTGTVQGDPTNSGIAWDFLVPGAFTNPAKISNATGNTTTYTAPSPINGVYTSAVLATPVRNPLYSATTFINLYPVLTHTAPTLPAGKVGTAYSFQLVSSGGASPITWSITAGALPFGLSLSPNGLISGIPTTAATTSFTVTVADSASTPMTFSDALTLVINPATITITTPSIPGALINQPYSVSLAAQYGMLPYKWTLTTGSVLPMGLTFSTAGLLSGTPTVAGNYSFTVQVADSSTPAGTATEVLTMGVYTPLAITPTTPPQGSIKDAYSATLQSTGGDSPINWTVSSGSLPAGLKLSSAGVITGTPTTVGTSNFTVKASDSFVPAQTATASYSITIVLSTLAITTKTLSAGTTGTAYSVNLASTGGNAPVTWALSGGTTLPDGLGITAAGLISGTPNTLGTYNFTVSATDSTPATVTQALSIKVVAPSDLKITTTSLPAGNIDTAYSATLAASLGQSPYTWSLAVGSGALPSGFTLSAAGVLSGITLIAGTYDIIVAVTDSAGATVTQPLTLAIGTTLPAGAGNAQLTGTYAFQLSGKLSGSTAGQVYSFAAVGSLAANGSGAVTGVEDINAPTGSQLAVATTGTYSLGTDGRGFLVLTAGSSTTVYSIAASAAVSGISPSFTISEFDNSTGSGSVASGSATLQTTSAFAVATLKGTFAFGMSGESPCSTCATAVRLGPIVAVGIFTADGVSAISGGNEDSSEYGKNYSGVTITGTFTAPSTTTGRGTLTLKPAGTNFIAPPAAFTYVIVNANQLLLLSTDSHATTAMLYGEARLRQQTTYSTANFSGVSIAYESKADGGDGVTVYPTTLDAYVAAMTNLTAGSDTYQVDSNVAGVYTAGPANALTYTMPTTPVASSVNGRFQVSTDVGTAHLLYLYDIGSGYALDPASTGNYPGLVRYELQVPVGSAQEPLLVGSYSTGNIATPVATTMATGEDRFTFITGGVDGNIGGKIAATTDGSSVAGVLTLGQVANSTYSEDNTGRFSLSDATTAATNGVAYAITGARGVSIPTTSDATPVVTILQQ
jgi:hypothetical protein